tara:strand:- start:16358 stop:17356 length:999 start_codon:yes stop_codon:yes gene_type:complete
MNDINTINKKPLSGFAQKIVDEILFKPAEEFLSRPKKGVRSELVQLGFMASDQQIDKSVVEKIASIVESIHSGSLIVDDIQDNSPVRRSKPSLHRIHGIAKAINTGNWLYFSAFKKLDDLDVNERIKHRLGCILHDMLFSGHIGQALDIGVDITEVPADQIAAICESTIQLKTGELMAASVLLGAVAGGSSLKLEDELYQISLELGEILQTYDDLKILKIKPQNEECDQKNFEDLYNRRPCYVWKYAAEHTDPDALIQLKSAVASLPDTNPLRDWVKTFEIHKNTKLALDKQKKNLMNRIVDQFGPSEFNRPYVQPIISNLFQVLEIAYEQN